MCLQHGAQTRLAEARHRDHAPIWHGIACQARQGRPHLAADAQDQQVALQLGHVGNQVARRRGQVVFEGLFVLQALGKGQVIKQDCCCGPGRGH